MFQKMKNKLFLKAWSDTSPDLVSPRPPAGSQIRSKYTQGTRPTGTQCSGDRLEVSKKLRRRQCFSFPRPGECPLEAFLYKTGFFSCWLRCWRTSRVGATGGREGRKLRSPVSSRRSFRSPRWNSRCFILQHKMWKKKAVREGGDKVPSLPGQDRSHVDEFIVQVSTLPCCLFLSLW